MLSVFTPSHDPRFLDECYTSLKAQTNEDWEWLVLLNGGARWDVPEHDPRVNVIHTATTGSIGALKAEAVALCSGGVLVELDHDDLLVPAALERIAETFDQHPDAAMVYSDFAQIKADGSPDWSEFNRGHGWGYAPAKVGDTIYHQALSLEPTRHNVSLIWYAPNHVRAFTRSAYDVVGGYDVTLGVLDDQDLMMRLYEVGPFIRIPECLYLQRIHDTNTQKTANAFIQAETARRYWAAAGEAFHIRTHPEPDLTALWESREHGDLLRCEFDHPSHIWWYVHEATRQHLWPGVRWRFQLGAASGNHAVLVVVKDGPRLGGMTYL